MPAIEPYEITDNSGRKSGESLLVSTGGAANGQSLAHGIAICLDSARSQTRDNSSRVSLC